MRKYEKWIGYCFTDPRDNEQVVLLDIWVDELGKNRYQLLKTYQYENKEPWEWYTDWDEFKIMWNATATPGRERY